LNRQWLIIPEYDRLDESVALAEKYNAAFEYNDFFLPGVYQNKERVEEIIRTYTELDRDRSKDTLHGAFLDLAPNSMDCVIKEYSETVMEQSMEIAKRLGVSGVIFHSGLVSGVENRPYIENWLACMSELFGRFATDYPNIGIYLENTVERVPDYHIELMEKMHGGGRTLSGGKAGNVRLCLDYAHAALTTTSLEEWVSKFAPYLAHMHVNDNDLRRDMHAVPGEESIDFAEFKALLEKYNVNVPILLELRGIEGQRKALEYMTGL